MSRATSTLWVFYDGSCVMCTSSVAWALARDTRGLLRAEPAQSPEATARLGSRVGESLGSLHVWSQDAGVQKGSDAVAAMAARLPGWSWAAALLTLPPVRPLAQATYRVFAANRHRFGGAQACALPARPASDPRGD